MTSMPPKIPDTQVLRRIATIADLSENHLIALANRLELRRAKDRELLLKRGSTDDTSLFIVEGKVSLRAQDGRNRVVSIGATDELRPLAQLRPSIYDVRAIGPVSYLRMDKQSLIELTELSAADAEDISVHSLFTDGDAEDNSIVNHLYRNLMDNSIELPSLPSVAERVQQIYRGEDSDVEALVGILVSYPDVTRKIDEVARSDDRSDLDAAHKIRHAIDRLGLLSVYCLIMTYAIGKLVGRLPQDRMQRVGSFWEHSLGVAAIGRVLARPRKSLSSDLAMLAGLVHGIGVLAIDDRLLEHRHLMLDRLEVDHAIQVMRPEISSLLLRKWDFGEELIQVAEECGDWSRDHAGPADLCDLVLVANYYGMLHSDIDHALPRADSIPAIGRLGVSPQESIDAIRRAPVVIRGMRRFFA